MTRTVPTTIIRGSAVLAAAVLAGAALGPATAVAAPSAKAETRTQAAAPTESKYLGSVMFLSVCQQRGQAAVQSGNWTSYSCRPRAATQPLWDLWVHR